MSPGATMHNAESAPVADRALQGSEGFFYCGHCNHVALLPESAEANCYEKFKCPRCRKWAVTWRFPAPAGKRRTVPRPVPAKSEFALGAFAAMREAIQ